MSLSLVFITIQCQPHLKAVMKPDFLKRREILD